MKKYKVYALTCPENIDDIKYIGYTKNLLLVRLGQHLMESERRHGRKDEWLRNLSKAPLIILLFSFDKSKEALAKESELIISYELKGNVLFNEAGNFKRRHKNQKPVYQYDKKGNFIAEYESAGQCAVKNMFFDYKNINACCNGSKKSHHGYMFSFEKHDKIKPHFYKASVPGKKVYQYSMDWVFIKEYGNAKRAEEQTGIDYRAIWGVCTGHRNAKQTGGFRWSYIKK